MNMKYKKLLLVSYGGGHARMLRPVVDRMERKGGYEISILALTTAKKEYEGVDSSILGYKDFFTSDKVIRYGRELVAEMGAVADYDESVAYMGQNFLELVDKHGEEEAYRQYRKLGRQGFHPLKSLLHIIKTMSPDLVVATNSPRSERAAIEAAGMLDTPSLALIDMFAIRCLPWFLSPAFANKICVLSNHVRDHLIEKGCAADKVCVTGNPAFDSLVSYYNQNRNDIERQRSARPYTVLWASQVEPEYAGDLGKRGDPGLPEKVEKVLLEGLLDDERFHLIIRNHPNEPVRSYPDAVEISTQKEDLVGLLVRVDLVVTLTSTVGFQGMILGADFITIDKSVFTETMPFSKMGLSSGIDDLQQLLPLINIMAVANKPYRKDIPYNIDDAADRVCLEIEKLMSTSHENNSH
jgi:hypothetical protein